MLIYILKLIFLNILTTITLFIITSFKTIKMLVVIVTK